MKYPIFITGLFLLACHLPAQTPETVVKAFLQKFPDASAVRWEAEDDGTFEADFKQHKKHMSVSFDANGNWLETETAIATKSLPDAVKAAIAKNFPGFETEEAEQVEKPDGTILYEVELEKEDSGINEEIEALFSVDGKLLKQQKETEDDKGEGKDDDNSGTNHER